MGIFSNFKEPTEMDRVMEYITQAEGEIQQKIYQLGQCYYENNKDNPNVENVYCEMITQINKLSENRKGYYKNKLRLEGKMMCENCGAIIPYGSRFCNQCGKTADEKQEDSVVPDNDSAYKTCNRCGTRLEVDAVFCSCCGNNVGE